MARAEPAYDAPPEPIEYPMGVARGQVAATYIVAEAEDGLVIVDQHAAHERLVLERMRKASSNGGVAMQALLLPEVVELGETQCDRMEARMDELRAFGLDLERFGSSPISPTNSSPMAKRFRSRSGSTPSRAPWPATARSALAAFSRLPK
jgi:DNA mismatch repair ATPase MutL